MNARRNSRALLRAAAVLGALFAAGHTFGTLTLAVDPRNQAAHAVQVLVEGQSLRLIELFVGYGHVWTAWLVLQVAMLWLLAAAHADDGTAPGFNGSRGESRLARTLVAFLVLTNLAGALVSLRYLIWIPVAFQAVLGLLLALAWLAMRPRS